MKNLPDKIWLNKDHSVWLQDPKSAEYTEYVHKDAFIEMVCKFLKSYRQDTHDGCGYIAGIVNDKTIEDFKKYMKGE